jgi:hypothetical protein
MLTLDLEKIIYITNAELSKMLIHKLHLVDNLLARLSLFGSSNSVELLRFLRIQTFDIQMKSLGNPLGSGSDLFSAYNTIIENTYNGFISVVSTESGTNFVDDRITNILKNATGKKINDKPSRDNNKPIWDHQGEGASARGE